MQLWLGLAGHNLNIKEEIEMDAAVKIFGKEFTFNNVSSTIAHKDTYDEEGKSIKTISTLPLGLLTTTYEYDEKGQLVKSIGKLKSTDKTQIPIGKPPRIVNIFERDDQGRVVKTVESVFNGSEELKTTTTYEYDVEDKGRKDNTVVTTTDEQNKSIAIEKYHGDEMEPYYYILKFMGNPGHVICKKTIGDLINGDDHFKTRAVRSISGENSLTLFKLIKLKDGTEKFYKSSFLAYKDFDHKELVASEKYTYDEYGRKSSIEYDQDDHIDKFTHVYKDSDSVYPDKIISEPDKELGIEVLFFEFDPEQGVIPLKEYKPGCYVVYNSIESTFGFKDSPTNYHEKNVDLDALLLHPSEDYAQFTGLDVLYHKDCLTYVNLFYTVGRFNIEYKTDTENYKLNLIKSVDKDGKKITLTTLTVANKDKTGKTDQTIVIQDNDDTIGEIVSMILDKSGHSKDIQALNAIAFKAWTLSAEEESDSKEDNSNIVKFKKN